MLRSRNRKGHFTIVKEPVRPNWKFILHATVVTMSRQEVLDAPYVDGRLVVCAQGCSTDMKDLKSLEVSLSTLKHLVDSDHEFQQYNFVYRQLRGLEELVLREMRPLALVKQDLTYIERRFQQENLARTQALIAVALHVPRFEVRGRTLIQRIRHTFKALRQMALFYETDLYFYNPQLSDTVAVDCVSDSTSMPPADGTRSMWCCGWAAQLFSRLLRCCTCNRCQLRTTPRHPAALGYQGDNDG